MSENKHVFPWGVYIGDLIDRNEFLPLYLDSTNDLIRHIEEEHLEYIEKQAKSIREDLADLSK